MDTTAETFVGAGDNEQGLLVLQRLRLRVVEDRVRGLAVRPGLRHRLLGFGKAGGRNNLHRVGDLLDVLDGLEAALDLTESGEVGGIGRSRP